MVGARGHFDSSPVWLGGAGSGRVAPEPGSPRNSGDDDGTFCPAGMSACVAFWLNCRARMYATMSQRSRGGIWSAYSGMAPKPLVITPKKYPSGALRRRSVWYEGGF